MGGGKWEVGGGGGRSEVGSWKVVGGGRWEAGGWKCDVGGGGWDAVCKWGVERGKWEVRGVGWREGGRAPGGLGINRTPLEEQTLHDGAQCPDVHYKYTHQHLHLNACMIKLTFGNLEARTPHVRHTAARQQCITGRVRLSAKYLTTNSDTSNRSNAKSRGGIKCVRMRQERRALQKAKKA